MKFLITGGAGFIGSHLCDALISQGHQVIVLDNLTTGFQENINKKAEFVLGDITDVLLVKKIMSEIDGCFHLAGIASVTRSKEDWLGCNNVNLVGSITIFEAAKTLLPKKKIPIIYASSSAVYGNNPNMPLSETATLMPVSAYGVDKLSSELHAKIATDIHGVPTIGLRFFNVFGPRQNPSSIYSGVISIFMNNIYAKKPIMIYGKGDQTRDFIFVEDVVSALMAAFYSSDQFKGEVYNVCTGRNISINSLAEVIGSTLNMDFEKIYQPPRMEDIQISLGNPGKAVNDLKFVASHTVLSGLSKMTPSIRQ